MRVDWLSRAARWGRGIGPRVAHSISVSGGSGGSQGGMWLFVCGVDVSLGSWFGP